jgi:hypothetical protein
MEFLVDEVALGGVFLRTLSIYRFSIIPLSSKKYLEYDSIVKQNHSPFLFIGGLFKNVSVEGYIGRMATRRLAHVTVAACARHCCGWCTLLVWLSQAACKK